MDSQKAEQARKRIGEHDISATCLLEAKCRMKKVGSKNDVGGMIRMYQDRLIFLSNSFSIRTIQILYDHIKETTKWLVFGIELNKCMMVLSVHDNNIKSDFLDPVIIGNGNKYGFDFRKLADKEQAESIIRERRSSTVK